MRRKLLLVLLGLGSVAGFASGAQSLRGHHEGGWGCRFRGHSERLDALSEACVRAAERVLEGRAPPVP